VSAPAREQSAHADFLESLIEAQHGRGDHEHIGPIAGCSLCAQASRVDGDQAASEEVG
jgi:hypothetical protein